MVGEASGIYSSCTSTRVSGLTAKISMGHALKMKMWQLLETDTPRKRLWKVKKKKSKWIFKSSGSLLAGISSQAKLVVLWLGVDTFSGRVPITTKAWTIAETSWLILQQVNKTPAKRSTLPRCDTDPPVQRTLLAVSACALPAAGPRTPPFHKHNTRHGKWSDSPSGCAFWPKN